MDVLPLVVHGDHPQNSTDEEQQHCNGVTSSVHEQPLATQSELITAERRHGSVTILVLNARDHRRKLPGGMLPGLWAAEQH